jgi:BirA family biotin operon repressor/biotin-[acetyl-CoA-carboxylase] ligase
MPLPVLRLLSAVEFRSGEDIAQRLSVTRASVNNAVREAQGLGVVIHAVRGRGYRLGYRYDWLDATRLDTAGGKAGFAFQVHDRLASTNSHLLALAQQGAVHKSVVAAELQSDGRGRRGRAWQAQLGRGLTFSLLWRFQRPLTALSGLSLVVGLALARCLRRLGADTVRVKWPNDVLIGTGKLAGILIETHGDMLSSATAVIGIGLNLALTDEVAALAGVQVASLVDVVPRLPERNDLLLAILQELDADLRRFDASGFAPFADDWLSLHAFQGEQVVIHGVNGVLHQGRVSGVDADGALLIDTPEGRVAVHSGEVSLRPC